MPRAATACVGNDGTLRFLPAFPQGIDLASVHGRPAAALLVFLPRSARTRFVAPDLGSRSPGWRRKFGVGVSFLLFPEIPIRSHKPRRHVHDDVFALLRRDRLGAHLRVFIVLVVQSHHRDHASAVLLVVDKIGPAVVAHAHPAHEAASPVVAVPDAVVVLNHERHVNIILGEPPGDSVPVPHYQRQDFVRLFEARELASVGGSPPTTSGRYSLGTTASGPAIRAAKNPSSSSTFIALPPLQLFRKSPRRSSSASVRGSDSAKTVIAIFELLCLLLYDTTPCCPSLRRLASNPEYRLCGRSLCTAMASAFFCPTRTTSFFPRVIPV